MAYAASRVSVEVWREARPPPSCSVASTMDLGLRGIHPPQKSFCFGGRVLREGEAWQGCVGSGAWMRSGSGRRVGSSRKSEGPQGVMPRGLVRDSVAGDARLGREVPDGALFLLYGKVGGEEQSRVNHVGFVEHFNPVDEVVNTLEGTPTPLEVGKVEGHTAGRGSSPGSTGSCCTGSE